MENYDILKKKVCEYFKILKATVQDGRQKPRVEMEKYYVEHPELNSFQLKAVQYKILSETIDTVVFEETPFYFINNITWCPGLLSNSLAVWAYMKNRGLRIEGTPPDIRQKFVDQMNLGLFAANGAYLDEVHFTVAVENVVKYGLEKFWLDAEKAKTGATAEELDFLNSAQTGLAAVKTICERYAETAREKLNSVQNPKHRENLQMLIDAASASPWKAPKSFFEGLNACWICRNIIGAMEGIGNSTLGRIDYLLYDLYKNDIEKGVLTPESAYELMKQFMLLGDMQYDKDEPVISGNDHELEMGIGIGGCDPDGNPVYNEITSMAIRAHREMKCVFPKIHARFGSDSPREYLEELAEEYVNGRSVIGLSCDDGIIPALVYTGKTLEDARSYETVGCWENKVPKKESMAGGNYVYLVPILEQAVYGPEQKFIDAGFKALPLENAESFEDVYNIMLDNARRVIRFRCETIGTYGKKLIYRINPLCLSSALMDGCIESRKDYTQGGGIYNINTCELAGFANYVDAMLVIKKLCFDEKTVTINELLGAVRNNWEGNEELLHKARSCPHFCDNTDESNALAQRLHLDLCKSLEGIENEHGGTYHLNYYVYREFIQRSKDMRATPDGRRNGDYFAQGIGPSKYHEPDSLSDVCQSVCALDRNKYITGSLDIQLPFGKTTKEQLVVLLLTFAKLGIKHLQINCVDLETLKKARQNPELYQDLVVRITGFSAKFVSLSEEFQDEFIRRHTYEE